MDAKNTSKQHSGRAPDLQLTEAVRPAPKSTPLLREGYRVQSYRDPHSGKELALLAAAVSRPMLFDVFLDLLGVLGDSVDVVLESSHHDPKKHADFCRERIDLPVLQSHFLDYEDLLVNDGCSGVAIVNSTQTIEVQFDEHKLLIVYADHLHEFEHILRSSGIRRDDRLRLISEGEHLHRTNAGFASQFEQLCYRIGVGETAEQMNW